jgi:hypothetical protein
MELKSLVSAKAQAIARESTPIENLIQSDKTCHKLMMRIQDWYRVHGLSMVNSLRERTAKLTVLFGFAPSFAATHEFKTHIWGLLWEDNRFIFGYSNRGISIEVMPDFPKEKIVDLLTQLADLIAPVQSVPIIAGDLSLYHYRLPFYWSGGAAGLVLAPTKVKAETAIRERYLANNDINKSAIISITPVSRSDIADSGNILEIIRYER